MVVQYPSDISGRQKLQCILAKPRERCSRSGEKICCCELRAAFIRPFKTIISYSRCSKSGCLLGSRRIIGARSLSVAELGIQSLVMFHAIWKRRREP
jgi:hypothetical protein